VVDVADHEVVAVAHQHEDVNHLGREALVYSLEHRIPLSTVVISGL
jgi:hypothetical protein